jgi:hypothetical protein
LNDILSAFGLEANNFEISKFGSGHINHTYLLSSLKEKYILQKINIQVFKEPQIIAKNIHQTSEYLSKTHPDYLFIHEIKTSDNKSLLEKNGEYWRLSPFIAQSYSINTLKDPQMAFEAATAFALLTKNLHSMPIDGLEPSIKGFHDLSLRFDQFKEALKNAQNSKKEEADLEIKLALKYQYLVETYEEIINDANYPIRMIHHDTKINNVLFNEDTHKSLCVCDLDTLMPGRIISDLGDMVRTYTCEESEESINFEKIAIRKPYFEALVQGYLSIMKPFLTPSEKKHLFYSGPFMIYMQGLRFLTDFLNNDIYYPTKHAMHNLHRAKNQRFLLENLLKHEQQFNKFIANILSEQ